MNLRSTDFKDNGFIPKKFTCDGENISPEFEIYGIAHTVKSLVIIMHDHDAASGDFVHWLMWNIDPRCSVIHENMTPIGAMEGTNDFPSVGWNGPCPPSGTHRYEFHLFALDVLLDLPETANKNDLRSLIEGHILSESSLVGLYPSK